MIQPQVSSMLSQALTFPGSAENGVTLNPEITTIMHDAIYKVAYKQVTPAQAAKQLIVDTGRVLDELKAAQ